MSKHIHHFFRIRRHGACIWTVTMIALVLALSAVGTGLAFADTSGPASPRITLSVHDHPSNGTDGYIDTRASNGATYSYRYSGGEGVGGDVIFRSRGRVTVSVTLDDGSRYSIDQVGFQGDTHQQLSWLTSQSSADQAVIQDVNDAVQEARYKVTVSDAQGNVTVPCDPIMANRG